MLLSRQPLRRALRACVAISLPFLMAACGGRGGGDIETPTPAPPIDPPAARLFTNFQAASVVIGQPNHEGGEPNQGLDTSDRGLAFPQGMTLAPSGELLVADSDNNRILVFPSVPQASGAAARAVIGQAALNTSIVEVSAQGLHAPAGVAVGAGKIAVADMFASRVLIYDHMPVAGVRLSATVVIGQPDPESSTSGCAADQLNLPSAVAITPGGRLIVADSGNHRVLVWDTIPTDPDNVPPPTLVLGQGDFDHCVSNDDEPQDGTTDRGPDGQPRASAQTLSTPMDVWSDDDRLVVVDSQNSRVLVWTAFPERSFQPANRVLGHSTFTDSMPNSEADGPGTGGPTARTMNLPSGIHSDGIGLVVADTNNHRVLIWNTFPDTSFRAADVVLGHQDFDRRASNDGDGDGMADGPTSQVLNLPQRVLLTPDALLVSDREHNRVLVFRR